jgi:hypothetical protein
MKKLTLPMSTAVTLFAFLWNVGHEDKVDRQQARVLAKAVWDAAGFPPQEEES